MLEELTRQGILTEPWWKAKFRKVTWWRSDTTKAAVEASAEFMKGAKLLSAGLGAVSIWLRHSTEEIKRIALTLPGRRFVVVIDDLDRTSPALLAKFLLSIRELLDLPGFVFVMGFDDAIVSQAIKDENPAFSEGHDFLAKILDFRFSLPQVTDVGKRQLILRAIAEWAPFVPTASVDPVFDLLPGNPREIKAIVRGLLSIKAAVDRHNDTEFNWTDAWLVQLLRRESIRVADLLLDEKVFDKILGVGFQVSGSGREREVVMNDPFDELLDQALIKYDLNRSRLKQLVEAMRARGSHRLTEMFNWFRRLPAMTWKEFDQLVAALRSEQNAQSLRRLLNQHASTREEPLERVEQEFIEAVNGRINEFLQGSRSITLTEEVADTYGQVSWYESLADTFFSLPSTLTAERFKLFYDRCQYWIAVRRDGVEGAARASERERLLSWTASLDRSTAVEVYTDLQPWKRETVEPPFLNNGVRTALLTDISALLEPRVVDSFISFLTDGSSVQRLAEPGHLIAYKALFFAQSGQWNARVRACIVEVLSLKHDWAYPNASSLGNLLLDALKYRHSDLSQDDVRRFSVDDELLQTMWSTLVSRRLLERGNLRLLGLRQLLIEFGASEQAMPLGEDLLEQLPQFEQKREAICNAM